MNIDSTRNAQKFKTLHEIKKQHDVFQDYMVKCKCSHTMLFTQEKDRLICSYCGNYVYRDEKAKIKYKLKELLK